VPTNVREFVLNVSKVANGLPAELVGKRHRALALEALRGVVLMSPVRSGRFRGNWQVGLLNPVTGIMETLDPSGYATIAAGSEVIARIQPFTATYLSNNLPYARVIEDGSSKQAPAGVVAVTLARLQVMVE
jgi:hypothetical protein